MAINGVPAFGPQEADSNNAVNGNGVPGARFWYGHAGGATWHVHNPQMGKKQFHPTSFLVMPWMGFQSMALVTMTRLNDFDNILLIKNVNMPEFKSKKHEIINTKRKKDL